MARDILGEFGPDSHQAQAPRATTGGVKEAKPLSYDPPKGPTNMHHEGPGLADHTNHGNCGSQGKH